MNKKCMKCGKPATHKFVRIEDDQILDMYYCQEHAQEKSPYQKPKVQLSEILASFLSQEQAAQAPAEGETEIRCKTCGLAFSAYKKTLFLGCADCYESFYELLLPELRKFHGNIKHIGRRPGGGKEAPEGSGMIVPVQSEELQEIKAPPKGAAAPKVKVAHPPELAEPKDPLKEIAELTAEMNKAIAAEDFERAAHFRDRIKDLRAGLQQK